RALNFVQSLYSSCHRDRVFKFSCKYNKATRGECSWSGWVNHFDKLVHYKCPDNGFLTGIGSYHHDHYEDRRFRFRCCHNKRYIRHSCVLPAISITGGQPSTSGPHLDTTWWEQQVSMTTGRSK
ncbi:hypothetical protein QZH41_017762, partial [Actinostola sp. cb2023]